ncbi:MAG: sugar phosphate nucleotidyltransferase [Candidatus Micrarchaeota archaeon]|nr:sugar phosphate nucleotidyltransferase [Candidatus Micrarchaeota archaeon]
MDPCVILAAGKSKRFYPFENKLLFEVLGKPLIVHLINLLKANFKTFYVVAKDDSIVNEVKKFFPELSIRPVYQLEQLGTAHAILQCEDQILDDFYVVAGDVLFDKNLVKHFMDFVEENKYKFEKFVVAKKLSQTMEYGLIEEKANVITNIIEKPVNNASGYVNTSIYHFKQTIFDELKKVKLSKRGEYEVTDILKGAYCYNTELEWIDLGYPWKLLDCLDLLFDFYESRLEGEVIDSKVKGKIIIEKGSVIEDSYVDGNLYLGKNSTVGPNSYIRGNVSIGDNSHIGESTTIKESIVGSKTNAKHLTYIGDSVIGDDCNFGSSSQVANFRFDGNSVLVETNNMKIDSKRKKLGVLMGNNVKIGVNAVFLPGKIIGSNVWIYPNSIVDRNVHDNTIFKTKYENEITHKKVPD